MEKPKIAHDAQVKPIQLNAKKLLMSCISNEATQSTLDKQISFMLWHSQMLTHSYTDQEWILQPEVYYITTLLLSHNHYL